MIDLSMEKELPTKNNAFNILDLPAMMRVACKKIAPVWPLENFVAVNPYLGLIDQRFEDVAQELSYVNGIEMTLPESFYLQKIAQGVITREDLAFALQRLGDVEVESLIEKVKITSQETQEQAKIPTLADTATLITKTDWNRFITARISTWAASYFDVGQAVWPVANQQEGLFAAWRAEAEVDRTPELSGLKGFRRAVKALPQNHLEATDAALTLLEIPESGLPFYLHRLLLGVGGWSAYAARLDWDSELYGGSDGKLMEFLAVLICWEACLLQCTDHPQLRKEWKEAKIAMSVAEGMKAISASLTQKLILQEAFDRATQRGVIEKLRDHQPTKPVKSTQARAQAIFCIDVRSEVYRRNLELVDDQIETLGFAGFFAFPLKFVPIGHDSGEAQCPVLLQTGPTILEEISDKSENQEAYDRRLLKQQAQQVWKSFKSGAITCFSFVSPMGLSFLPKLFTDSFGFTRPVPHPEQAGMKKKHTDQKSISLEVATHNHETVGIPVDQQLQMGKNALKAMSLTEDFGRFVMIVGHGSTTVNNPYATGLDCGACGGHTGEANARVAAAVLNSKEVRAGLQKEGILIPESTVFLACLHDTTTDEVAIFNEMDVPASQQAELAELKKSLELAGHATRTERILRMTTNGQSNADKAITTRSKDWSQVRPEWGLAGCSAFVVAPRERTQGIDLEGKSFLHSYDWKKDEGFGVLELIMTAPMVVTSWINLQYYGSTVDNKNFGSGNKTLHNVTAGVGVLEGYSGDLRVGLPWQSVHDGKDYQHEPLRLNVFIEAPIDAMNEVLKKHSSVRNLCDNGWLKLLAINESGKVSRRYAGHLEWEKIEG